MYAGVKIYVLLNLQFLKTYNISVHENDIRAFVKMIFCLLQILVIYFKKVPFEERFLFLVTTFFLVSLK